KLLRVYPVACLSQQGGLPPKPDRNSARTPKALPRASPPLSARPGGKGRKSMKTMDFASARRFGLLGLMALFAAAASQPAAAEDKKLCGLGNGQKATGEPILVGSVVGRTGPDDFSAGARAAAAYFKCVNDNGGINGRPIEYVVEDDQWNPEV